MVPCFCPPTPPLSNGSRTECKHPWWQECWPAFSECLGRAGCLRGTCQEHMPGAGTSLPNLREGKNLPVAASHWAHVNIPCRAERGSSSSSQAGDENGSPRIPLLLLTGWLPGDVGSSTTMVSLTPQAGLRSCASPCHTAPASLTTGVQHWSCQVILLYNPSKATSPRWISQKFWQAHLGYADHYLVCQQPFWKLL